MGHADQTIVHYVEQGSAEWHELRRMRITASRAGAILGVDPYKTRADVMREMVRAELGYPPEFTGNAATEWGNEHEKDARAAYEWEKMVKTEVVGIGIHPEYDFLAASPDGLVGDDGMSEYKCPYSSQYTSIKERPAYETQVQHGLSVFVERKWMDFCIWRKEEPLIVEHIEKDGGYLERNLPAFRAFMDELREILATPEMHSAYIDADDDDTLVTLCADWRSVRDQIKELEALKKDLESQITALAPNGTETRYAKVSKSERTSTRWRDVALDLVELVEGAEIDAFAELHTSKRESFTFTAPEIDF